MSNSEGRMETEKGRTGLLQARGPAGAGLPPSPGVGLCLPQPDKTGTHQPPPILSREHTQAHTQSREARLHMTTVRSAPAQTEMSRSHSAASDLPLLQVCHIRALEGCFQEVGELIVDWVRAFQMP